MKTNKLLILGALMAILAALPVVVKPRTAMAASEDTLSAATIVPGARFVHTATPDNISGHWTTIDHPLTNNYPNAILFVTQNWNPGGMGGTYNESAIGVRYDNIENKWAIFNQTLSSMPEGAAFNVLIPEVDASVFVHTAITGNITDHWTTIDHSLTNNNPNAIVLVTQNWNPGGAVGIYNDHPIGLWYNGIVNKWAVFNQDLSNMPEGASFNILIPEVDISSFVHTATSINTSVHWTTIDHPLVNDNPNAILFVTQNWNPGEVGGIYNDQIIGVWYSNANGRWAIFNQDFSSMPEGAAFNVLIPITGSAAFAHTATPENITGHWTTIDHPLTNNNPNAILFVTMNWISNGFSGIYNDHSIGVWYHSIEDRWAIFNQDFISIPEGAVFNILIPNVDTSVFVHTATAGNIIGNWTTIDHPLTNNNPDAIILVTQNWNPGELGGIYNDNNIGVWYSDTIGKWAIFNQDNTSSMPLNAAFNVMVSTADTDAYIHTATPDNTGYHLTTVNHHLINDNPHALVFLAQNWNPGGAGGIYNDHPIGVWYARDAGRWAIFNQDTSSTMPEGASFNVVMVGFKVFLPLTQR